MTDDEWERLTARWAELEEAQRGPEVAARPRQRWALILAVAGVTAIVLLLGGTRV